MARTSETSYEFLLIARHGSRDKGLKDVRETCERLQKTLNDLGKAEPAVEIRFVRVAPSASPDAREAAELFGDVMRSNMRVHGFKPCPEERKADPTLGLGPDLITAYQDREAASTNVEAAWTAVEAYFKRHRDHRKRPTGDCLVNALMLVGNQPAVDWFLADGRKVGVGRLGRVFGRVDFKPISVAAAEVVCLAREVQEGRTWRTPWHCWHLWWVITPTVEDALEPLRQKVQSKMTILSVLAGFTAAMVTAVMVALAGPDIRHPWDRLLLLVATALLSVATILHVVALVAYDRLMMPHRFWGTVRPSKGPVPVGSGAVARPPSSAGWVLYQHSVKVWRRVIRALILTGAGCVLMVIAAARFCDATQVEIDGGACPLPPLNSEVLGVVVVAPFLAAGAYIAWLRMRPHLGSED